MDFTVAGLINDESAKAKAEQTKTKVKVLYKGWVFSKKKAEEEAKKKAEEDATKDADKHAQEDLLVQIRDLLAQQVTKNNGSN